MGACSHLGWVMEVCAFVLSCETDEATEDSTGQSLPNPRGGSAACSSVRSSSQIVRRASAVAAAGTSGIDASAKRQADSLPTKALQ